MHVPVFRWALRKHLPFCSLSFIYQWPVVPCSQIIWERILWKCRILPRRNSWLRLQLLASRHLAPVEGIIFKDFWTTKSELLQCWAWVQFVVRLWCWAKNKTSIRLSLARSDYFASVCDDCPARWSIAQWLEPFKWTFNGPWAKMQCSASFSKAAEVGMDMKNDESISFSKVAPDAVRGRDPVKSHAFTSFIQAFSATMH